MTRVNVEVLLSGSERTAADVEVPGLGRRELYIEANVPLATDATPWLPIGLPLAMRAGVPLHLSGSVDAKAKAGALQAAEVLSGWFTELTPVAVEADEGPPQRPTDGVGSFFSGGVDSFYSALARQDEITHLIFAHGFDIPISDEDLGRRALEEVRRAAQAMGKPLIEIRTNVRELSEGFVHWGKHYHGALLAAVAHALSPVLGRVIVPASYYVDELYPWGSHPDLDPLWSGSGVTLEHHGEHATRPQKVELIAQHQVALDHLRVCWRNEGGAYNCGRCEKCLRTMLNLRAVDALDRCRTLPSRLDPADIKRMHLSHGDHIFAMENLAALRRSSQRDPALEKALERAVLLSRARRPLARAKDFVLAKVGRA